MLVLAAVMFLLSAPLAMINLAMALINFLLLWIVSRRNADLSKRFAQAAGKLSGIEMNGIQIIETLKANAVEDQFFNYWAAVHAQKISCEQRMEISEEILKILPVLLQGLNIVALLAMGSWFILQGLLTPGGLIALQLLMISFNRPLIELLEAGEHLNKLKGNVARMLDINNHSLEHILNNSASATALPATFRFAYFRIARY